MSAGLAGVEGAQQAIYCHQRLSYLGDGNTLSLHLAAERSEKPANPNTTICVVLNVVR